MILNYQSNSVHRNGTKGKTQWCKTISINEEEKIFRFGESNNWSSGCNIFSFLWNGKLPVPFIDENKELNYARYVGDSDWHGFPANVKRSPNDLPPYCILNEWAQKRYTTRPRIHKLMRRQKCTI